MVLLLFISHGITLSQSIKPVVPGSVQEREAQVQMMIDKLRIAPHEKKAGYLIALGNIYYSLSREQQALAAYKAASSLLPATNPEQPSLYAYISQCSEATGDLQNAWLYGLRNKDSKGDYGDIALERLYKISNNLKQYEQIAHIITLQQDTELSDARIGVFRATMMKVSDINQVKSVTFYDEWLKKHSNHPDAILIALDRYRLKQPTGSEIPADLERLCSIYSIKSAAGIHVLYALANAYSRINKDKETIRVCKLIQDTLPNVNPTSCFFSNDLVRGTMKLQVYSYDAIGDKQSSKRIATQLIRQHPKSTDAYNVKSWMVSAFPSASVNTSSRIGNTIRILGAILLLLIVTSRTIKYLRAKREL